MYTLKKINASISTKKPVLRLVHGAVLVTTVGGDRHQIYIVV
jgi:hypothetical protein